MYKSDVATELGFNFLSYAAACNSDRAIPDSRDGLKPVAKRILFIMDDEGTRSNKPHKKCAKTVGSVMGRVHPHGDTAIYEAMVRLSQPWAMRYPLIDWHGNQGTQAGDGAAAMRYTESRLAKISEAGLLAGLKKKNVDFVPTFDDTEEEPVVLPALFPNLLCNPNSGIGVALACNWLPNNLTEVGNAICAYLKDSSVNLLDYVSAPDFPTGGLIVNGEEVKNAYKTGKGRALVRARYEVETRGRKKLLVFYEVPFGVNTENLLNQINDACTKEEITGIDEVRDESNKKSLRIVAELSKDANPDAVARQLYRSSDLQKSCSFNQVALVDKTPTLLNLEDCVKIYIKTNLDIICKEAKFDLNKIEARLIIVNGLLKALEDIDNIIALIKKSESSAKAKDALIEKYGFLEEQAKAIIDMKLGKLAGLEKVELQNEKAELDTNKEKLNALLSSEKNQKEELGKRLKDFVNTFGDKRRTEVTNLDLSKKTDEKKAEEVIPEDVVVIMTQSGYIKRVPKKNFRTQKRNGKGVKNKDDILLGTIRTNTQDSLMMFTSNGKMFKILVDEIPESTMGAKGTRIGDIITLDSKEEISAITALQYKEAPKYVLFFTKGGLLKKTELEEYSKIKRGRKGIAAIKLKENDSIANVCFADEEDVLVVTKKGMSIKFSTSGVAPIGRIAAGVKTIKLDAGDEVIGGFIIKDKTDKIAVFSEKGMAKKCELSEFPIQNRGGKGVLIYKPTTVTGDIIGATLVSESDSVLLAGRPNSICIASTDIPTLTRASIGNIMTKSTIESVVKI